MGAGACPADAAEWEDERGACAQASVEGLPSSDVVTPLGTQQGSSKLWVATFLKKSEK